MNWKVAITLIMGLLLFSSPSWAQRKPRGTTASSTRAAEPRLDIILLGGHVWTLSKGASYDLNSGDLDLKSGAFYGVAVDVYGAPYMQVRLQYRRQDTQLTFKRANTVEELGDLAVEYWHIGGVKGIRQGNVLPFGTFSLGGTRYAYDGGDDWKFSIILGLGAKVYLNEKIGLMVTGQMPFSFTDAFVGVGTGGASLGGTGIAQFDVAAGLMITL